ncbi:hypothetical protein KY284_019991 [Solanum tuberosum]|nr:hypothetical protein KY284_019991 [Solanum tuberosum]
MNIIQKKKKLGDPAKPAGSAGPGPRGEPDRYRSSIPKAPIPREFDGTGSGEPVLEPVVGRGGPTRSPCQA